MQMKMLTAITHTSKHKIMKNEVDTYNAEKHRLPCWECVVRATCFSEKKATKKAKYLGYTVEFKKPCIECILEMDLINIAISGLLITPLHEIEDMNTSVLSEQIFELLMAIETDEIDRGKFGPEAYAMCINLIQRDPNQYEGDFAYTYYCLGEIYFFCFQEIEHAIELYSKAIDFDETDPFVFLARGYCFYNIGDYTNALNDFKKTIEIDRDLFDLGEEIEECENLTRYISPSTL